MLLVEFTQTITLGAVITGLLVAIGGLVTYFYGVRWKSLYEIEKENCASWKEGREAFRLRAERLEAQLGKERDERLHVVSELAAERMKTDLTYVLKQMSENQQALTDSRDVAVSQVRQSMNESEQRALDRHTEIVAALHEIATALKGVNGH